MAETINAKELMLSLRQHTCTEFYHEHRTIGNIKVLLTDGVHYLREKAQCYWLVDVILSWQYKLHKESFQVWSIKKIGNKGWDIIAEDGNKKQLVFQRISYSDFPVEDGIILYYNEGVLMLPSEY